MNVNVRKIIESYIEYYNNFEIDKMLNLFAENCIFENISNSSGVMICHGKQELGDLAFKSKSLFSSRKQTAYNWIMSDTKAAIEIEYQAIVAHDFHTFKAGDHIQLKGISIFEFEGDKIKRLADFS